jgi:hypothetical protein
MPNPFYSKPEAAQRRRLYAGGGASSIPTGHLVKVTTWPVSAADIGTAETCPDAEEPDMVVDVDLSDTSTSGEGSFCARDGIRVRAGGAFVDGDFLKLSSGRMVKAASGDTVYFQALTPAAAVNDLPLARYVGKKVLP